MELFERMLRLMAEKKASDLYLSANAQAMLKIDGLTRPIGAQVLSADAPLSLLGQMLDSVQIEELQRTGELNTALFIEGVGNFRISAFRQRASVAAVTRFVPQQIPPLGSLRVPAILANLVMEKRGLLLVAGATGAGKTTTLAAMIDHRNARTTGHILTIEDPIEYVHQNKKSIVNQRQIGSDTASLQVGLKNALRQAPDVILIGEIRDRETMSAALAYAQSGHLCLATMHANNSYHALGRVLSFYPAEVRPSVLIDLASSLRAIVSQRLVRTQAGPLIPATEVLLNTALIADLITKSDFMGIGQAIEKSLSAGLQSFEQDLARLISSAQISEDEGLAHADSPTNLMWCLQNSAQPPSATSSPGFASTAPDAFTGFTLDVKF